MMTSFKMKAPFDFKLNIFEDLLEYLKKFVVTATDLTFIVFRRASTAGILPLALGWRLVF